MGRRELVTDALTNYFAFELGKGQEDIEGKSPQAFEFAVGPGDANAQPDALIEREQIPQKWLRVPVDLGKFRIDLSLRLRNRSRPRSA